VTATVAILAAGAMGSAIARRLSDNGVEVLTSLAGRSPRTAERARESGMIVVDLPELARAQMFLSIVPPGAAVSAAEEIVAAFDAESRKPLYVDCNAINPGTAACVATAVRNGGMEYVDGGIIGGPPKPGYGGPILYLSGVKAREAAVLGEFGLSCHVLDGCYDASALKMSYAGITKGLTALASLMILGASNAGIADCLRSELLQSQPELLAWFERQIPSMSPKAWRWVAEMEEIASFLERQPEGEAIFRAVAKFYIRIAHEQSAEQVDALSRFFDPKPVQSG
jgi:3-hydroxyisobutyrate dehydrogenase-like beta-hydroxyacid dehydrogenase